MQELFDAVPENNQPAGFRLRYLEVLNWGTFNKVCWQINPDGHNSLLTGDIGSGKSTLVDALTCLLVPHNKIIFNKAAGAEGKERNLLSYVKGEYKKEKEEITKFAKKVYLRPEDDTYTVIIGNFYNEGYQENICLAQLLWTGKEGRVEKLLIIAHRPLTVREHFSGFTDISDVRKRLRGMEGVHLYNDNFTQYSEQFRRLFGMNSEKAIDLFYQTVSMKSVSSLTDFVREQMLERTDVKEQITALLKRFDDLNKAHAAVVHAREQYQILKPLTESCTGYAQVSKEIEELEVMLEAVPAWFAEKKAGLLKNKIEEAQEALHRETGGQERLAQERTDLQNRLMGIVQDIANNGGKRIEQIAEEMQRHEQNKKDKKQEAGQYTRLAVSCGLDPVEQEKDFEENIVKANRLHADCTGLEKGLRDRRDTLISELRKEQAEYKSEQQELQSLHARKTQIPAWLVGFRTKLCTDLRIGEEELPFAGELLKINDGELEWEGAIEKLLRDAGISLLVPRTHYRSVSRYVNDNLLRGPDGRGIKLTYLEADGEQDGRVTRQLDNDSVVNKIDVKPGTPFGNWLETHLQRSFGDCICVDVSSLQLVPFGITRQGLIKSGRIRHTKDDRQRLDDRRNYVLGWSNAEKIKVLETSLGKLEQEINRLNAETKQIENRQAENDQLKQQLAILLSLKDFSRINWQHHVEKIHLLENERHDLLNNNDVLALLEKSKDAVNASIDEVKQKETASAEKTGGLKRDILHFSEQQTDATQRAAQLEQSRKDTWFPVFEEKMGGKAITLRNADSRQEEFRKQYQGESGELKKLRGKQTSTRSAIEKRMREIKEHSRAEYSELAESIDARNEYIQKFGKLASEDLKRHEERFKNELNKNTINSIAVFDSQLEKHEKDIRQKIRAINQHLYGIVYNAAQDTYITIQMDATPKKEVRLFREELKKCYVHSFSSNSELYTEEKYEQVKRILDQFASAESSAKEWTATVTDVRQWFEFNASERFRANNAEKEFYEGSGGKSGGQKEKLAYTILASALAYQFGLQFGERKSRSFRFVVIDEAFGRGSDESTRYGLELFKKLNLQLLIVTPLQKLHVIEDHVNSFHFVSNREGNNSQVSNLTKEQYEAEKKEHIHLFNAVTTSHDQSGRNQATGI